MGLVTYDEFAARMQAALGNLNYDGTLINLWINAGVQEVAGAVDFDCLKQRIDLAFVEGTYEYVAPDDLIRPISIGWLAESRWLIRSTPTRMDGLKRTRNNRPRFYCLEDRTIRVWETPDRDSTASLLYIKYHPQLGGTVTTTLFPPTWDNAVHYFGVTAAMLDLGDDERAAYWFDRATRYAGSRITDAEYGAEAVSEPVRVVTEGSDLYTQRSK